MKKRLPQGALSWGLYDWANSAFVLTVVTVFYGPMFQNYWFDGNPEQALFWQGVSVTISSLLVAIAAPFLGALANRGAVKKHYLRTFMLIGVVSTVLLALVPRGMWELAVPLRIVAAMGFFGSLIFYDSLLPDVSEPENRHVISGLGFSLGYLGSVLLFAGQFVVVSNPSLIGLTGDDAVFSAIKLSFLTVAVWWLVFTFPLLRHVQEKGEAPTVPFGQALRGVGGDLADNFRALRLCRPALLFLLAYYFYIDGVNTLTQMATGFATTIGIDGTQLMVAIIIVQVVGVPFAILVGWLGQKFRPRPLIIACIVVYLGVTAYAWKLQAASVDLFGVEIPEIYIMGFLIGTVQGGLQALSRSVFVSLIPEGREAGFFGFFNMLGKGGAILGPLLMGGMGYVTGDARWGALAVAMLFLIGLLLILRVPLPKSKSRPIEAAAE